jgi:hypothetical protein
MHRLPSAYGCGEPGPGTNTCGVCGLLAALRR